MPADRPAPGALAVLDDRYVLQEVIGRGGMADVYRASDRLLHREVAVKLLRDVAASEADRVRFDAEARTLARLSHPGLVTVLDAGTADDRPYLVMELIAGSTLADSAGRPLDSDRVAEIGGQVADALSYAHAAGIVHRDVKPGNVLLGPAGRVWLADFGIARLLADTARHTSTGLVVGTASYVSPEQVQGLEVTPASDVYSLALVLLEALTGRREYPGPGVEAAMARVGRRPQIPPELPSGWPDLLAAMTDDNPANRPTATDVAARLRQLSSDATAIQPLGDTHTRPLPDPAVAQPAPAATGAPTRATYPPIAGRARGRLWALAAVAIALAVVAVWTVVHLSSGASGGDSVRMPPDVPPRLEQPLRGLHDAVNGGAS